MFYNVLIGYDRGRMLNSLGSEGVKHTRLFSKCFGLILEIHFDYFFEVRIWKTIYLHQPAYSHFNPHKIKGGK